MKATKLYLLFFSFLLLISFGFYSAKAQETKHGDNVCNELKIAALSVAVDEIVVAGEVIAPQTVKTRKTLTTLSHYLASVGGIKRPTSGETIQIVKCSSNLETVESVALADYAKIKKGLEPDLELKGGEIIIVLNSNSEETPSVLPAFKPHCGCGLYRIKDFKCL